MTRAMQAVMLIIPLLTFSQIDANAATAPHPECPWVNPENSWVDFITGRVPARGRANYVFSIRFDEMHDITDSRKYTGEDDPLGRIWAGSCYTVGLDKDGWFAAGVNETNSESPFFRTSVDAAPPDDYLIAIGERVFQFNEAGEVFDADYGHVGNLRCVLARQICRQYAE
ncbi:MAG: hypothetical protein OXF33_08955 [Rhodospirillales bacterium]|nr:hypothetical protein [Rhodospirillales bacterium]